MFKELLSHISRSCDNMTALITAYICGSGDIDSLIYKHAKYLQDLLVLLEYTENDIKSF